ncbi:hypothetical protein [Actinacidiphila yeochonensis]|uniref:hypothetical protein n=1 Tax=Actinacidiphila yeochonensis TaxID=89050 RepID=UPI00068A37E1|nr:hypothetical protein [Actinacidiphila yeochonensis]
MSATFPPPQPPADQNPYAQPVPVADNPYAQPVPVADNPYAQPVPPADNPYAAAPSAPQGLPATPYGPPAGAPQTPAEAAAAPFGPPVGAAAPLPAAGYPGGAAVPPRQGKPGLAIGLGVVAAVVAALAYGGLLRAMAKSDGTTTELRYAALAVGLLVGVVMGKVGGRHKALPFLAVLITLLSVVAGEIFGLALVVSHFFAQHNQDVSATSLLLHHFHILFTGWKSDFGAMRAFYLVLAGVAAFGLTKRTGES